MNKYIKTLLFLQQLDPPYALANVTNTKAVLQTLMALSVTVMTLAGSSMMIVAMDSIKSVAQVNNTNMFWFLCNLTEAAICVDNCGSAKSFTSRTGAKCSCKESCKKVGNCCEDYTDVCETKKIYKIKGSEKEPKNANSGGNDSNA